MFYNVGMYNHQLDTFLCVADCGSFSKAAEILFVSPSAVIKQINLLEKTVGIPLFERSRRGLKLTPGGESLCRDARHLIAFSEEAAERAREAMQVQADVIRIGTSAITPASEIRDLLAEIQKNHFSFRYEIVPFENTPEDALDKL
ncbi:MAG: LysR family transcriptional regulator, partial [Bulleidia sp.]